MSPDTKAALFKEKLYALHVENPKYLIPQAQYYNMIAELKLASTETYSKRRRDYYLLSKYEITMCGD